MHRLSIVIPCPVFNESAEDTLVSVLQNRPNHCEVIVVTAGKYDDPYDLEDEVVFVEEDEGASLVQLANSGVEVAKAEIVHVLNPGMQVVEGWTEPVLKHFADSCVAAVSPAVLHEASDTCAALLGVGYRSCGIRRVIGKRAKLSGTKLGEMTILAPSFDAGFYRRKVLTALGGFDESIGASFADAEFGLAARQLGFRAAVETTSKVICGRAGNSPESSFQSARQSERLYRRYAVGGVGNTILHGFVAAGDLIGAFPRPQMIARICGRLAAWCESRVQERQLDRLQRAQACLDRVILPSGSTAKFADHSRDRSKQRHVVSRSQQRRAA